MHFPANKTNELGHLNLSFRNLKTFQLFERQNIFNAILSFQPKTMYLHFYYLSEHKTELHNFMLRFQTIT